MASGHSLAHLADEVGALADADFVALEYYSGMSFERYEIGRNRDTSRDFKIKILPKGRRRLEELQKKQLDDSTIDRLSSSELLRQNGHEASLRELNEAHTDLRRIAPDLSGAVHHAMAALENTAKVIAGDSRATLPQILKKQQIVLPPPLDVVVDKAWAFSSDRARHISGTRYIAFAEAELMVSIADAAVVFLLREPKNAVLPE